MTLGTLANRLAGAHPLVGAPREASGGVAYGGGPGRQHFVLRIYYETWRVWK